MSNPALRIMSLKEFIEEGYLQELNRKFLHPCGLALSVMMDEETGEAEFADIIDARDDPEGYAFDDEHMKKNLATFKHKADNVEKQRKKHSRARCKLFNRKAIQPIPDEDSITPNKSL